VRFQKLMWCNMMRSIKSQKVSILYYSIDYAFYSLKLQLAITFTYAVQFEHMTRYFDRLEIKFHLMAFNF
jgi:hypothetical protein